MKVFVITYPTPKNLDVIIKKEPTDIIIGVDKAFAYAIEQNIKVDKVIGDFDSLESKSLLKGYDHITLPAEKDITDTEAALIHAYSLNPEQVILCGGLGGKRPEFSYLHLLFFNQYPYLVIQDEHSRIFLIKNETYIFENITDCYISFFAYSDAYITLKGFKYPLKNYHLKQYDRLAVSNEVIQEVAQAIVKGSVLAFVSDK